MQSFNQYERLSKVKAMLDSDIDSITDMREDSLVFQPRNSTGNPNVKETHTPQNKTVGVDVRATRELHNKKVKKLAQDLLISMEREMIRQSLLSRSEFEKNFSQRN